MIRAWTNRDTSSSRATAWALMASFLMMAMLLVWAYTSWGSRRAAVEEMLRYFSAFAAERYTAALDAEFQAIFFDQLYASRVAHLNQPREHVDELPTSQIPLQPGMVRFHFSADVDEGSIRSRGERPDSGLASWIREEVLYHARTVYATKLQAPYAALLRVEGSRTDLVVYRAEDTDEDDGLEAYGFVADLTAFGPIYRRVLARADLFPANLSHVERPLDLVSVTLRPPGGETLFRSFGLARGRIAGPEASAAKAGRLLARVAFDPASADQLIPGGVPGSPLPVLLLFFVVASGLFALAAVQVRRERELIRLREDFVANVSHELRTPLTQIRMFAESLLLGRLGDARDRRRSLEVIHRESGHLADLVENVLALTKTRGAPEPRTRLADPHGIALEAVESLRPTAEKQDATVIVEGETHPVQLDVDVFRRSLLNLLDNALKYGPHGQTVRVVVETDDAGVSLTVVDQGPGVPSRKRDEIWERFQRLDETRGGVAGAGIGLAVVREMVVSRGGSVDVGDAPGRGARFNVFLPFGTER